MKIDKNYLAEAIKRGLRDEVAPVLDPGRELLVVQIACELIDDLAGRQLLDDNILNADIARLVQSAAGRGDGDLGGVGELLAGAGSTRGVESEAAGSLRYAVAAEVEARISHLPSLRSAHELSASGALPGQPDPQSSSAARLRAYLEKRDVLGREYTLTAVRRLASGMVKETYIATFRAASGAEQKLFIRRDGTFPFIRTTVLDEYPLLKHLQSFRLPIPDVLLCETDPTICGAPFMVVKSISGVSDMRSWGDPGTVRSIGLSAARFLAQLHAIPTQNLIAAPPKWLDPMHMCRSVQGLRAEWSRTELREPLMEAVLAWLQFNEPRFGQRQVLVHGDMGFQNLLVENGQISGVLDWEMCHLGPPAEDLLYIRPFLAAGLSWDEFLEAYRSNGGQYEPSSNERFYSVFGLARIAMGLHNILHALQQHDSRLDTKEIYIGTRYAKRVALEAFKATL